MSMERKVHPPVPLAGPTASGLGSAQQVAVGVPITPIQRLRIISPVEWEHFVVEWVDSLRPAYRDVQRCGSSGDMGRDVIGVVDVDNWDNYQCKHYAAPLAIADILPEIAKLVYYTHAGEYTYPQRYYFVAPQGAGTQLINILAKPQRLKERLVRDWSEDKVPHAPAKLNDDLRGQIASADFSIFEAPTPQRLVEEHARTRWHVLRFGGGLPPRPRAEPPPTDPTQHEVRYVQALLAAYGDHKRAPVPSVDELFTFPELKAHFDRQREDFYSAESLRAFSRDNLPPQAFEVVQEDVFRGIVDICEMPHADGYRCVQQATHVARQLPLSAHALDSRIFTSDRGGICHQLANDGRVKWVKWP